MKEILELLNSFEFIVDYEIEEYREFKDGFYVKIAAHLSNTTNLHIREYSDAAERDCSYHWQDKDNRLIARWDNSPYHKQIPTYPHHKYLRGKIQPSYEITAQDILRYIQRELKNNPFNPSSVRENREE
jgi:hypothetical protein